MSEGLYQSFGDVWLLAGLRTPMGDYNGAFADASWGLSSACIEHGQGMTLLIQKPDGH